ncbi:Inner membrane metabolite transport protein YgcS [Paenibacillus konkukensis]|uniref:Inner membrane metabolite transport protein YgcS n=1 Tax=Paenibacillus konkukensis TaxID=2020716 RepID=A0ABY4RWA1_9BACL|nr:MFS transporter [Paenibacillus konkukensis]UQZ86110.1 Inner membrane metabolite transport protein YgcS [Paenibacillus konkukensis]
MNEQARVLEVRSRRDIVDFINSNPVSKPGFKIILLALAGVFVDAYDFTSIGIGTAQLQQQFGLTAVELGSLTAIMAVGSLLGAVFGGYYTDKFGRNKMFLIDLFLMVFAAFGAALSPNFGWLVFFRLLMGIGVGLDIPVALSFIAEYSNMKKKGANVTLWCPLWFSAASVTGLIALPFYFLNQHEYIWRWSVGLGGVFALIVLFLRYFYMNESPLWAAHHLSLEESANVIRKTYQIEVRVHPAAKSTPDAPSKAKLSYAEIFRGKYKLRTILASIITFTQSMEYFAVGFYIPTISTIIFGKGVIYAIIGTIVFNLFGALGGFLGASLNTRWGVRKLSIVGYVIAVIGLLLMGTTGNSYVGVSAVLLAAFIFGHAFGPGSQGMTMATLSYPTELRGLGAGFGQGITRVGSILGFFLFPVVLAAAGLYNTLLLLAIVPFLGLAATLLIKWEPIGQDVESEGIAS